MPLPAAPAVFRGVSCRRLPLGGYATFLAPVACPAPAVELGLLGLQCRLVFCLVPCSSSRACGLHCFPCHRLLRCLWVPRSCGVNGLRDGDTCLRSGLWSSSVHDRYEAFPSFRWVWFLSFVRGSLSQADAVFFGMR